MVMILILTGRDEIVVVRASGLHPVRRASRPDLDEIDGWSAPAHLDASPPLRRSVIQHDQSMSGWKARLGNIPCFLQGEKVELYQQVGGFC